MIRGVKVFTLFFSIALSSQLSAEVQPIITQTPDSGNAILATGNSDLCWYGLTGFVAAEDFTLSKTTSLQQLKIWGIYADPKGASEPDDFTVIFHEDLAGLPGQIANGGNAIFSGPAQSKTLTGRQVVYFTDASQLHDEYAFQFSLSGMSLPAGKYWVEIYNNLENSCFHWESSDSHDQLAGTIRYAESADIPGKNWSLGYYYDLAFEINGILDDSDSEATFDDLMGLSGPWYDPSNDGDGFNLLVIDRPGEKPLLVVFFYGYDLDGNRMWLISNAISPANASYIEGTPMFYPSGSGFQGAGDHSLAPFGELDFTITGCGRGQFTLRNGDAIYRNWDAVQIADIPGPGCLLGTGPRKYETIAGLSGAWFNSSEPGDGLNLITTDYGLAAYFYGYDKNRQPLWLIASDLYDGPIIPGNEITLNMVQGSGGKLGDVNGSNLESWGTMSLVFKDCLSAVASLNGLDGTRSISLTQLAKIGNTRCEAPGTVQLSEPTLTLEAAGETREIGIVLRDATGAPQSLDGLEISIQESGVASMQALNTSGASFRSETNQASSTKVTFWSPIYNAVEEMPVSVVDLQPNAVFIPYPLVQSWEIPSEKENSQIILDRASVTDTIVPGSYIASEGGLVAFAKSVDVQSNRVVVDGSFASLPDVYWNLKLDLDQLQSTVQFTPKYKHSVEKDGSIKKKPVIAKFEMQPLMQSSGSVSCESGYDYDDVFSAGTKFELMLAETKAEIDLEVKEGRFLPGLSDITFETKLEGTVEVGFKPGASANVEIKCNLFSYSLETQPPVYGFVGLLDLSTGFNFNLKSDFPEPLVWELGAKLEAGIDFSQNSNDRFFSKLSGAAGNGKWLTLKESSIKSLQFNNELSFKPYFNGSIGIGLFSGKAAALKFAHADVSLPYKLQWLFPEDTNSPDFTGPWEQFSLKANANIQAEFSSDLLKYVGVGPVVLGPNLSLFDFNYILRESPYVNLNGIHCDGDCGVGDKFDFDLNIHRQGLFDFDVKGTAYLLGSLESESGTVTERVSRDISASNPSTIRMSFNPDKQGNWVVLPRFWDRATGITYGGPANIFSVGGGSPDTKKLNVGINGSGSVMSSPAGINCPSVSCAADFETGSSVTLSANAENYNGWEFDSWSGDINCDANQSNCSITMDANKSISAVFTPSVYSLTLNIPDAISGVNIQPSNHTCGGTQCVYNYEHGTVVTLTAVAKEDWIFSWSGDCAGENLTCQLTMDGTKTVGAEWTSSTPRISISVNGQGTVTSEPEGIDCPGDCENSFNLGEWVTLTSTPAEGYYLENWGGLCPGSVADGCRLKGIYRDRLASATFQSRPTASDLRSSWVSFEGFFYLTEIQNIGKSPSSETLVRIFRSSDAVISGDDVEVDQFDLAPLEAGQVTIFNGESDTGSSSGDCYYACIDTYGGEHRDDNNCSVPYGWGPDDLYTPSQCGDWKD